jgi:hypothetical protein
MKKSRHEQDSSYCNYCRIYLIEQNPVPNHEKIYGVFMQIQILVSTGIHSFDQ